MGGGVAVALRLREQPLAIAAAPEGEQQRQQPRDKAAPAMPSAAVLDSKNDTHNDDVPAAIGIMRLLRRPGHRHSKTLPDDKL